MKAMALFHTMVLLIFSALIGSSQPGTLVWHTPGTLFPNGGATWSTPVATGGRIYCQGQDGGMVCMDANTGNILWVNTGDFGSTLNSFIVYEGTIFSNNNGRFMAANAQTGVLKWFRNDVNALPGVATPIKDGKIFVATSTGLHAIDITNGVDQWSLTLAFTGILISPDGSKLLGVSNLPARITATNPSNGNTIWGYAVSDANARLANIAMSGDVMVVTAGVNVNDTSQIYFAFNTITQKEVWIKNGLGYTSVGSAPYAPPAIHDTVVVISRRDIPGETSQHVTGFSLNTGNILWSRPARQNGSSLTPIIVALDGKAYYENDGADTSAPQGYICVNIYTGDTVWTVTPNPLPTITWAGLLIYNNRLYAAPDFGGGLFCFEAGTVAGLWPMPGNNLYGTNKYEPTLIPLSVPSIVHSASFQTENYPNPFNERTVITYDLAVSTQVTITILNLMGQQVTVLFAGKQEQGLHAIEWDATQMPEGMYLCKITSTGSDNSISLRKLQVNH